MCEKWSETPSKLLYPPCFLQALVTALLRLPFASEIKLPPFSMNVSTYESIRPAVVGPKEPDGIPSGVLAGPA